LEEWSKAFDSKGLGGFFMPCPYLKAAAKSGTKLQAGVSKSSKM